MNANPLQGIVSLLGRMMIAIIFLLSAVGSKIPDFNNVVEIMESNGVPMPKVMLVGAIVFLVLGSLSIIAGFKARIGAALLAIFLVLATYFFHDFWNIEGPDKQMETIAFMKNLSMLGTMFFFMANGTGALSLDNLSKKTTD